MTVYFTIDRVQTRTNANSLFIPVEYLYGVTMREKSYEKPPLSDRQLEIFKKHHQMDFYLYDLALKKFDRQVAAFGHDRMEAEVEKLKSYAEKCRTNSQSCMKSKFITVRNSPNQKQIMKMTEVKVKRGDRIRTKIDRDYGKSKDIRLTASGPTCSDQFWISLVFISMVKIF